MKRILMLVSVISMLFSKVIFAAESEEFYSGDYQYILLEDGTAEIENYTGETAELVIPDELDGHTVTSIGYSAFYERSNLISITLPASLRSIEDGAFSMCSGLTSIAFPERLTSIGDYAFSYCSSLTSITLPESISSIGANPFSGCKEILFSVSPDHPYLAVMDGVLFNKQDKKLICCPDVKEVYTVPEGIMSIGDNAFSMCSSLTSITLPVSLTNIGEWAFSHCSSLTSITLPEGITSIGDGAFSHCNILTVVLQRDSYAVQYCRENGLNYTYPDANDWLSAPSENSESN